MDTGNTQKIRITICPNYFDRSKQISKEIDYVDGLSVNGLVCDLFPQNFPVIVSVNGKVIKDKDYFLSPGEQVLFIPKLGNLAKYDPWEAAKKVVESFTNPRGSVLDSIMDSLHAGIASIPLVSELQSATEDFGKNNPWFVQIAAGVAGYFSFGVGAFLVGWAANRYLTTRGEAPTIPHIPGAGSITSGGGGGGMGGGEGGGSGFVQSNSYSWNPVTLQQLGAAIPKIYGTFRTKGNIITGSVSVIEGGTHPGDQVLNILILLCQGPICNISDVQINRKDLVSFAAVTVNYKYGDISQNVIPNFNDTNRPYDLSFSKLLSLVNAEYTTVGNDFDALKITITFLNGLYFVKPVSTELHYDDVYVDGTNPDGTHYHTLVGQKYLGSTMYGGDTVAASVLFAIYYRKNGDSAWIYAPGDSGIGDSGQYIITESKTSSFVKEFKLDNLEKGSRYDIIVVRITANETTPGLQDDMYFTGITEIIKDDFRYPRSVLVGLETLATSQLSGSVDFSCLVDGSIVLQYTGTEWVAGWSDNPAWVAYDILTQPVFRGGGISKYTLGGIDPKGTNRYLPNYYIERYDGVDPAYVDTDSFKAWADFCDELVPDGASGYEKRFVFNGIFDSASSVWDSILEVCKMSRAMVYIRGYKYYAIFDAVATPVQMFTSGNIIADSFEETFLSLTSRATEIEVDFANEDNDYKRETITIVDPNATRPKQLTTEQLIGCTSIKQAWRVGRYRLYNNQYVVRFIKFDADIDAIACNIGDLIYFAHDLPQWGFSGRLVSAASTSVTLDRDVTLTTGITYGLRIRLSDDTIVYKTTTGTGTVSTLNVSAFSTVPSALDIYTFGVAGLEYKPFRINKIQPNPDLKFTIEAVEYNATIFNCDTDEPAYPTPNYSSLIAVPQVTNITLDEIVTKNQDGTIVNNIDVYWDVPLEFSWIYAEVWYKSVSQPGYSFAGRSYTDRLRIANLPLSGGPELYTILIASVNSLNQKLPFDDCPTKTLTVLGMSDPPSNVAVFYAEQINDQIRLDWKHIEDADLFGYEIRVGNAWDTGLVIGSGITDNYFTYCPELDGTYEFFICAIDTTNHYSVTPKSVITTVANVTPSLNIIYDHDYMLTPASGTAYNFTYGSGTVQCSGAFAMQFTMAAGSGYFYTNVIDMLKTGQKTIRFIDSIDATEDATDLTFPDRTDLTYPDDTDTHITGEYYKFPSFQYSTGSGFGSAEFQPYYSPVTVDGRFFRFREDFVIESNTANLGICQFRCVIDVPETKYKLPNISIAEAGTTITFATYGLTFYATPLIQATVVNATISLAPVISSKSATSCVIKLLDIAGGARIGTVDLNLFGY